MAHEGSAQNVATEVHLLAIHFVGEISSESMVGRAKCDDGLARVEVADDELLLLHREGEEASDNDERVCFGEMFEPGDVVRFEFGLFSFFGIDRHGGVDFAIFIHPEENGRIEAMVFAENLCHHGQRLLTAVFLVCRDEYDVLSSSGAFFAGIGKPFGAFRDGVGRSESEAKQRREKE